MRRRLALPILFLSLAAPFLALAQDWPEFRGDESDSNSNPVMA